MRLLSLAIAIAIGFGIGAWGISRLLPTATPAWIGLTLSMVWLFLLIFMASLASSNVRSKTEDQRRLLAYGLLAAVLMSAFLMPLFVYNVKVPRWTAQAILAAIAGAVFLLSKYMERRRFQRTVR